jgi:putative transcriptional regulator
MAHPFFFLERKMKMVDGADLKKLRSALGMTQEEFCDTFCVPVASLRNWEQERAAPDKVAITLLFLISQDPEYVAGSLADFRDKKG